MKEKDMYTLEELCRSLEIPASDFCKEAHITEGTLARLRRGYSARISTINRVLKTFSRIHGIDFSIENVSGLVLQNAVNEKTASPPDIASMSNATVKTEAPQICPTTRNIDQSEIPDHLPRGTIKLADFAEMQCIRKDRMRDWVRDGIGGEKIETTREMVRRANGGSQTHFLTPEQQEKALDFLKRHGKLKKEQHEQQEKLWWTEEPPPTSE